MTVNFIQLEMALALAQARPSCGGGASDGDASGDDGGSESGLASHYWARRRRGAESSRPGRARPQGQFRRAQRLVPSRVAPGRLRSAVTRRLPVELAMVRPTQARALLPLIVTPASQHNRR
jgi:hypothetical protein